MGCGLRMPSLVPDKVHPGVGAGFDHFSLIKRIHLSTNHFKSCVQEYATVEFTAPRQSIKVPKDYLYIGINEKKSLSTQTLNEGQDVK